MSSRPVEEAVIEQYTCHPYPPIDPSRDYTGWNVPVGTNLNVLNSVLYAGKQDFSDYSILEAGCGTGENVLYYASALKNVPGKHRIVALDISKESLDILRERIKLRDLEDCNITIVQGSILDLQALGLEKFDLISCTGVLHHMASPLDGLKALNGALKPNGVMNIMVYGSSGRIATNAAKGFLSVALDGITDRKLRLEMGQAFLNTLPGTNPLRRLSTPRDDQKYGLPGLQDQFDHVQEIDYCITDIISWLDDAGLIFSGFNPHLAPYFRADQVFSGDLLKQIQTLSPQRQWLACEMALCTIFKHEFYATKKEGQLPPMERLDNYIITGIMGGAPVPIRKGILQRKIGDTFSFSLSTNVPVTSTLTITPDLKAVVRLLDGKMTIGKIKKKLAGIVSVDGVHSIVNALMHRLGCTGGVCLLVFKHKDCAFTHPDIEDEHDRWAETKVMHTKVSVESW